MSRTFVNRQKTKMDLSDLLIAHSAKSSGCECVLTFDKRASNFALFELLRQNDPNLFIMTK